MLFLVYTCSLGDLVKILSNIQMRNPGEEEHSNSQDSIFSLGVLSMAPF
jgi:hypothetical protein